MNAMHKFQILHFPEGIVNTCIRISNESQCSKLLLFIVLICPGYLNLKVVYGTVSSVVYYKFFAS